MTFVCISEFVLENGLLYTWKRWPVCCDIYTCSVAFLQATSDQCNWSASTDPIDGLCLAIVLDQASGTIFKSVPMLGSTSFSFCISIILPSEKVLISNCPSTPPHSIWPDVFIGSSSDFMCPILHPFYFSPSFSPQVPFTNNWEWKLQGLRWDYEVDKLCLSLKEFVYRLLWPLKSMTEIKPINV